MSGVDVLAVLDHQIQRSYNPFEPDNQAAWYPALVEARTTVAAMLEALQHIRNFTAYQDCDICCEMYVIARDAIASATGEGA